MSARHKERKKKGDMSARHKERKKRKGETCLLGIKKERKKERNKKKEETCLLGMQMAREFEPNIRLMNTFVVIWLFDCDINCMAIFSFLLIHKEHLYHFFALSRGKNLWSYEELNSLLLYV